MMTPLAGILVSCITVAPQPPPRFEMTVKATRFTESLHLRGGAGGNVIAFVWDDGVLLVDDKLAPAGPGLSSSTRPTSSTWAIAT